MLRLKTAKSTLAHQNHTKSTQKPTTKGFLQMAKNFLHNGIYALDFTLMDKKDSLYVLEMRNQPEVARFMLTSNITKDGHFNFIKGLKNNQKSAYWLVKKNDKILGVASLSRINLAHKNAYIGIYKNPFLDTRYKTNQKSSIGAQILQALEYIAFSEFCLHSLHLEVLESNTKAIAFYEKNGYKYGGKLVDFIYRDERYHTALIYSKITNMPL